jgi:hypothetical protein
MNRQHVAAVVWIAGWLVGCDGGGGGAGKDTAGPISSELPSCALGANMADIEEKLFRGPQCMACHGRVTLFPTTLDLASEGLAARVVDKLAEANPDKGKCAGKPMLAKQDPFAGVFVEKVAVARPSCGDPMPQAMPRLTADEISCVKRWALLAALGAP